MHSFSELNAAPAVAFILVEPGGAFVCRVSFELHPYALICLRSHLRLAIHHPLEQAGLVSYSSGSMSDLALAGSVSLLMRSKVALHIVGHIVMLAVGISADVCFSVPNLEDEIF